MMRIKSKYLLFALLLVVFGCKENNTVPAGEVNIHISVKHHNIPIPYSKVYIKNNTLEFPGKDTSLYDSFVFTDGTGYVKLSDIGNGDKKFIFYGTGVDPDWDSTGTTPVWGFQPIAIKTSPGEDKERYVTIPVSE